MSDSEMLRDMTLAHNVRVATLEEMRDEIERLRADFLYYADHKPHCRGGDGEHCACGYLDALAHQQSASPQ